jgi:antitoxin component YwqK of YwqJK toxin-antitoxin module
MLKRLQLLLSIVTIGVIYSYGQDFEKFTSYKHIQNGIKLHDEEKYKEAIIEFKKVNKNDTNFVLAVLELANSYIANKQDSLAVIACNQALHITSPYAPSVMLYKANALDNMGKSDEAIKIYQEGSKKYPLNYSFNYELGILYYKKKKYAEAHEMFVQALKVNPYHASSHLQMGNLAIQQGKIVPAMLAWSYFLTIESSTDRAKEVVIKLEKLSNNEFQFDDAITIESQKDLDDFSEVEALVKSKVALTNKYKSEIDINYTINKQLQLIVEKMTVDKSDKGFYMQFYAPIYKDIYKNDYFEPFIYSIFSGLKIPKVDSWNKKNKKTIEQFGDWFADYLGKNYLTYPTTLNGKTVTARHWYYNAGKISGIGNRNAANENIGYWNFYYPNGILKSEGEFTNASVPVGKWKYYTETGLISSTNTFVNGKVEGAVDAYYENGSILINKNFKNDQLDGTQISYYPTGVKKMTYLFKNGIQNGKETSYAPNGKLKYEVGVTNDKYEGEVKQYYENGHLKEKSTFKNGLRNDKSFDYHNYPENAVKTECFYTNGILTGDYKTYFPNGKIDEIGKFNKSGKRDGVWKSYFDNDSLFSIENYDNGKYDGITKYYDNKGRQTSESIYKNDYLLEYKAFDVKGKVIYQNKIDDKKNYTMSLRYANGNKIREGKIVEGKAEGEWKYYDKNGSLTEKTTFTNGLRQGKSLKFYETGKVKTEMFYVDDELEGYYKEFYKNGNTKREGVYAKDKFHGEWKYYYPDGKLKEIDFYKDDEYDGWQEYYAINGKLESEEYYELGYVKNRIIYDSLGNIFQDIQFNKGTGLYDLKFKNGKTNFKYNRENDFIQGAATAYYPNGQIRVTQNYLDGFLNGEIKYYYVDGKIQSQYNYVNGKKHGKQYQYFEDGNVKDETEYLYGELNGKDNDYYPNKQLKTSANYKNDELDGERYIYDETGELVIVRYYENGYFTSYSYKDNSGNLVKPIEVKNETGIIKAFFKNGQPSIEYNLKLGSIDGKRIIYHVNGKVASEEYYINSDQTGVNKYYYSSGKLRSEINYSNDEKNGKATYYHENGNLKSEEYYINGELNGELKKYDTNGKLISKFIYYNGYMIE